MDADDDDFSIDELSQMLAEDPEFSDDALADRHGESDVMPSVIVNWREITDDDRPEACRNLADWVQNWLIPRYNVTVRTLPDCWWQHSDLVEELSALHTAWLVAFDEGDAGYGPIGWHERWNVALQRPSFVRARCDGKHRPDPVRELPEVPESF
ncbi:MAG: DUF4913 domain-containing protein [Microbacterium sp.]